MNNELYHFGIKGMKWGIRRYQNPDGSLTAAGKRRYGDIYNDKGNLNKAGRAKYGTKSDIKRYGYSGASRIKKNTDKGLSKKDARAKERRRKTATDFAKIVGITTTATGTAMLGTYLIADLSIGGPGVSTAIDKGRTFISNYLDSKYNAAVLDSAGNVLKRYNNYVDVGKRLVDSVMK